MKTILITSALFLLATFAWSEENFVTVKLPRGVAAELPKNWIVHSRSDRITIDAAAQSIAEKAKMFDASSELSFAAGYIFAGKSASLFNIRYYPNLELTQKDARQFDEDSISVLDELIKENIVKAGELSSYTVPVWKGTIQREINGMSVFITEYHRRSKENDGDFVVRLVRVFDGASSFTITISYRESLEGVLRQICDHIIQSIAKA
ncbi:hypothetical protein ACWPKS_00925 [Coraliomargarita sp. W4R72]